MSVRMVLTLLLCLSWGSPTMAQHRVQLHPTGTVSQRTLLQVQNGTMEFANDSALPLSELYSFGQLRQQANRGWVVLRHGEVLVADQLKLSREGVEIQSLLWKPLTVSWKDVRAVIRNVPKVLSARDRLLDSIFDDEASHFVLFNRQTRIDGKFAIDEEEFLHLDASQSVQGLTVPFSSVKAFVMNEMQRNKTAELFVGFSDGSFGQASRVSRNGRQLTWETASQVRLTTADPLFVQEEVNVWENLICLRPLKTDVVFLDGLEETQSVSLPFFEGTLAHTEPLKYARPGHGRNAIGGMLRHANFTFQHGLGMKSLSRVTFDIPEAATTFISDIAIDSIAGTRGSVTFHVFLREDSRDWIPVYSSGVIRGGDRNQTIKVPLGEAKEISLVVGMADRATVADYANWLDARFILQQAR